MSGWVDLLGAAAGLLTTFALLPQTIKVWRSRSARDISLAMFVMATAGMALWVVYGVALGSWVIIIANGTTLTMAAAIILAKLRFG